MFSSENIYWFNSNNNQRKKNNLIYLNTSRNYKNNHEIDAIYFMHSILFSKLFFNNQIL